MLSPINEAELRQKALQCRRLAGGASDEQTRRVLLDMATDFDARAMIANAQQQDQRTR
jgi:hypothetical protein